MIILPHSNVLTYMYLQKVVQREPNLIQYDELMIEIVVEMVNCDVKERKILRT